MEAKGSAQKQEDKICYPLFLALAVLLLITISSWTTYYFKYFHSMNISCKDDFELNEYMAEIKKLPEEIQRSFILNQWSLSIAEEAFAEHYELTSRSSIGMTSMDSRKIWVRDTDALLHEFGHYIQSTLNEDYNKKIKECYEKEGKQCFDNRSLSDNVIRHISEAGQLYPELEQYANVDDEEYFAQYFKYWLENRNDEKKMKLLQDKTPDTYKLFIELESSNWCTNNNTIVAIIKDVKHLISLTYNQTKRGG